MKLKIAVLPGDGIGPEIMSVALDVVKATAKKFNHQLEYQTALVGACAIDATGSPYPEETHRLCMESDAVLFGAIGSPKYDNDPTEKCVRNKDCSPCANNSGCMPTYAP